MALETPPPANPLGARPAGLVQTGFVAWLRRYRRLIPIPLALIALIFLRPQRLFGSLWLETALDGLGVLLCMLGQWVRAWAWGSNAHVDKFGVRDRGPYALMRHPLYTGNFLIGLGLVVVFHNPWLYPFFLIPFAYLYYAIVAMEEQRLHWRFTDDYEGYRGVEVPRFFPALGNLGKAFNTTFPFGWELAVRKEYESVCGWVAGIVGIQLYEGIHAYGWASYWPYMRIWIGILVLIGIANVYLKRWKRRTKSSFLQKKNKTPDCER